LTIKTIKTIKTVFIFILLGFLAVFLFVVVHFFLAVFLLNGAAAVHADFLTFVSVAHVVENARLVHVDVDGAMFLCEQAVSFKF
jgi:hypothetical protein